MPSSQDSVSIRAVCVLRGGENNTIQGVINFAQTIGMNQMKITGDIQGLPTDRKLAIHVHEYGDITSGPGSTGNRFNPERKPTNTSKDPTFYIGSELGNLQISPEGQAKIDVLDKNLTLFGPSSIIGRSVVLIDDKEEDAVRVETEENKTVTTAANNRLAAGVIGICQ